MNHAPVRLAKTSTRQCTSRGLDTAWLAQRGAGQPRFRIDNSKWGRRGEGKGGGKRAVYQKQARTFPVQQLTPPPRCTGHESCVEMLQHVRGHTGHKHSQFNEFEQQITPLQPL